MGVIVSFVIVSGAGRLDAGAASNGRGDALEATAAAAAPADCNRLRREIRMRTAPSSIRRAHRPVPVFDALDERPPDVFLVGHPRPQHFPCRAGLVGDVEE